MGTLTLTVEGPILGTVAGGGGVVITKTSTDADVARMIAHFAARFAMPASNAADVGALFQRWFDVVCAQTVADVLEGEKRAAAAQAAAAVTAISVS